MPEISLDSVAMSELKVGDHFVTLLTHRYGVVKDKIGPAIEVDFGGERKIIHQNIRVKKLDHAIIGAAAAEPYLKDRKVVEDNKI